MADLEINNIEGTSTEEPKQEIKSTILSDEEIEKVVNEDTENKEQDEEVVLPSEEKDTTDTTNNEDEIEKLKKEIEELKSKSGGANEETLKEFAEKALKEGLQEEDYKELEKLGYDKDVVDTFVEGLKAKQSKSAEELLNGITTIDEYKEAVNWAASNWSEEQIKEFNEVISSGNTTAIRLAVRGLVVEAKGTLGKENTYLHANTNRVKPSVPQGYETKADMMRDMSDPRYGKDIAYTKKVEQKIKITDTAKWYQ